MIRNTISHISLPTLELNFSQPVHKYDNNPVNIRNILKGFKRLQNVVKTYFNHIIRFSKCFKVNVCTVILKKRFVNILSTNIFTENII